MKQTILKTQYKNYEDILSKTLKFKCMKQKPYKTYMAEIHTIIFWENDIHIMVHILDGTWKTCDNITKTPNLYEQNKETLLS